jgi:lincosamide nucleotidyltransferase A/C/D/E
MTLPDVLAFLQVCEELGTPVWLDGGWGVDALLGNQTRTHADLDLVIEARCSPTLVHYLGRGGFAPLRRADTSPWNLSFNDRHGRQVGLRVIEFDRAGDGHLGPEELYPAEALGGYGTIGERTVRCIAPQWQVLAHTGYAVEEQDWHDVSALCERFGIALPPDYDDFVGGRR